jgi:hypothetical protein
MRIDVANHRPTITPITFGAAGYFSSIAARAVARFSGVNRPRFILRTGILHPTVCRMLGVLDLHPTIPDSLIARSDRKRLAATVWTQA